jgi:hypothetical protein
VASDAFEVGFGAVVLGIVLIFLASVFMFFPFAVLERRETTGWILSTSDFYTLFAGVTFIAFIFGACGCLYIGSYLRARYARRRRVHPLLRQWSC